MKKKSLFISIVLVVLVLSVVLTGCSLFTTNTERQASREITSISVDLSKEYDGIKDVLGNDWNYVVNQVVTRREVISSANYMINYYQQLQQQGYSYSYDINTIIESARNSLTTEKYRVAMAMGKLLMDSKTTGRYDALYCLTAEYQEKYGKTLVPEGVLTVAEVYEARQAVEKNFKDSLDKYIEEEDDAERSNQKSEANDQLMSLYGQGYFVDSCSIAYLDNGEYADGLYSTALVAKTSDSEKEVDYTKVYAKVKLTKANSDDKFVYVPVDDENITLAEKEDAKFVAKYVTVKTATVTFSGRAYAEVTEENSDGYEINAFTSEPVEYDLITPRSKYVAPEEEDEELEKTLRYTTREAWAGSEENYTEAMKELKTEIFDFNVTTADAKLKDAYRQLKNAITKNTIGYVEEETDCETELDFFNLKYFNGLYYYYNSQFNSEVLSALEFELGDKVEVTDADIQAEYAVQYEKDKAGYAGLSEADQVDKFVSTVEKNLTSLYYIPVEALLDSKFEIDPTNKAYSSLFNFDENGNVIAFNGAFVEKDDETGKYYMYHAYEIGSKYFINIFYVGQILVSFDNVDGLDSAAKSLDTTGNELLTLYKKLYDDNIQSCPQLASYLNEYDEEHTYVVSEIFETENDEFKYYTGAEIAEAINEALSTATTYQEYVEMFLEEMNKWNDDSGAIDSNEYKNGYLVADGSIYEKWDKDFTAVALSVYYNQLVNGCINENGAIEIASDGAYSVDGKHTIIVAFAPFSNIEIDEDYAFPIESKLSVTSNDTRLSLLQESVLETKKSEAYTNWTNKYISDDVMAKATINETNYKNLIKDIG
ncbi:MAG: hypothetical protein K5765_09190 [Clostridia bacterium]|nr:hypothetical protein [Clostridia bacterium]